MDTLHTAHHYTRDVSQAGVINWVLFSTIDCVYNISDQLRHPSPPLVSETPAENTSCSLLNPGQDVLPFANCTTS